MRKRFSSNFITRHVQFYFSIYCFIMVLFVMGIIFGAIIVNSLSVAQKEDLFYYLNQFFGQVADGKIGKSEELLKISFFHNVKFVGLMWLLGISIIGFPLILILLFLKGVTIGFSVGFLVHQMGWNGLLLAFVTLLPQNLLIIPVYIFIGAISIAFSIKLIRKIFVRQGFSYRIVPEFARYFMSYIAVVAVITVAASIEAYAAPVLMKSILASLQG
ncbi:stage II sporulation protein M [Siminovitchia sp. FSL H7-0308]|uniref:Stage II sporulation protein M n=1 Tax=Siminovitchia thermophila TaxID=1245522 RepID=A0ABS2R230_9BACI|nr:stage II sporulation protein M [Siminovitchia thermophila]MBM7713697.1 stage II sporulation protein M [Siminovitchia thermophila]ONK21845.1 stage II sporulation protein M [Bacillus sp. VT-16-64]